MHSIIVGAGSAGCVLASRLSARNSRNVTLLDDGPALEPGNVPPGIDGPSFFEALAEPGRSHTELLATRVSGIAPTVYQRGRGIGGSSAVNAMVALRGSASLYRGWGWHDVDEAWERMLLQTETASDDEVGAIDRALRADPRTEAVQMTRRNRRRITAAEAYLWPVMDRPNLTVRPDSEVHSVLLSKGRACGVRLADGTELDADQVILAAGAIHSPTILLRSGVDTPGIGLGLQDHPSAVITLQLKEGIDQDTSAIPISSVLHASVEDNLLQLLPLSHLGPDPATAGFGALMAALMTPKGRDGSVTLDPDGGPVIDFALLEDDRDLNALAQAVELALDVINGSAFTDVVAAAYIDDVGTTTDELRNQDAIKDWLRGHCADYVHASSTCAMGTVVSYDGGVFGYGALHVCDASVFPTIPDANTHLPTTMLAERLSQLLME